VGIIARVPLASGLLTGKYSKETSFPEDDHRNYNRAGDSFDVGETFSGVDYQLGLKAVAEFEQLVPEGATTAQAAIAWIVAQEGVTSVIPGARNVEQAQSNAAAAGVSLGAEFDDGVRWIYNHYFREAVHPRW
jgi:aryl-alcohol dehydrogenase-like predicted oxidoreductase